MRKILIGLGILILVVLTVIGVHYFWLSEIHYECLDGGATWYFDRQFISLQDIDLIKQVVAISSSCGKTTYKIKEFGLDKKVSKNEFDKFLQNYNLNCNDCLVYSQRSMGSHRIDFNYSDRKKL